MWVQVEQCGKMGSSTISGSGSGAWAGNGGGMGISSSSLTFVMNGVYVDPSLISMINVGSDVLVGAVVVGVGGLIGIGVRSVW